MREGSSYWYSNSPRSGHRQHRPTGLRKKFNQGEQLETFESGSQFGHENGLSVLNQLYPN